MDASRTPGRAKRGGGARLGGANSCTRSSSPPPNLPEALIGGEEGGAVGLEEEGYQ